MVNQAFHVPRHVGLFTALLTPLRLPEGSQLSGASRNSGCTPCCCVIAMPWFSKCPPTLWLTGLHRNKPNKLMSQIWAASSSSPNTLYSHASWLCCWSQGLWSDDMRCGNSSGLVLEETGVKSDQCCTKATHLQELLFSGRKERRHIFSLMWHFEMKEWVFNSFKELRVVEF